MNPTELISLMVMACLEGLCSTPKLMISNRSILLVNERESKAFSLKAIFSGTILSFMQQCKQLNYKNHLSVFTLRKIYQHRYMAGTKDSQSSSPSLLLVKPRICHVKPQSSFSLGLRYFHSFLCYFLQKTVEQEDYRQLLSSLPGVFPASVQGDCCLHISQDESVRAQECLLPWYLSLYRECQVGHPVLLLKCQAFPERLTWATLCKTVFPDPMVFHSFHHLISS